MTPKLSFLQEMEEGTPLHAELESASTHGRSKGNLEPQVTRNWRITFRIYPTEGEVLDRDYEDYH